MARAASPGCSSKARRATILSWKRLRRGLACKRLDETRFSVEMGHPRFAWSEIPLRGPVPDTGKIALDLPATGALPEAALVNMGNPHAVFFIEDARAL